MKLFIHKLLNWEYWSNKIVYIPIYFQWLFYAIKARSLFFFNASNPSFPNGGFINDSKEEIYKLIPQKYYPKTKLVNHQVSKEKLTNLLSENSFKFPLIAKPDMGLRGVAVKKINSISELKNYHNKATFSYLIQDLIPYQKEVGIFYVKFPRQKTGKITGIVKKEFMIVEGNGRNTIEELIKQNPRYELQLKSLRKEYQDDLQKVLEKGKKMNLVPYGSHSRGSKFIDISHRVSEQMNHTFNQICNEIKGFHYGRLDVMYDNWEDLKKGENFSIVEINGAGSEPTHIYDPKHTIFFAWKELSRHFAYMFKIARINNLNGVQYLSYKEAIKQINIHRKLVNHITKF